jgi:hypothetical protein
MHPYQFVDEDCKYKIYQCSKASSLKYLVVSMNKSRTKKLS